VSKPNKKVRHNAVVSTPQQPFQHDNIDIQFPQASDAVEGETPPQSKHSKRMEALKLKWASVTAELEHGMISMYGEKTGGCIMCTKEATHRCHDCSSSALYCDTCGINLHKHVKFHKPEVFIDGRYEVMGGRSPCLETEHNRSCPEKKQTHYVIVTDAAGRQHEQEVKTCEHEEVTVVMLEHGLWCASPSKPTVAFTLEHMYLVRSLVLNGKVSLNGIVDSLKNASRPLEDKFWMLF